ncbi:NmrA family protein [Exiguobacterium sp. BMC-KP]|uniref:SDR family oxidoreductase n=1 Tax=Exiguobacterium sp. BMC-KP TaxID=1684312 RepID=UPI0006AA3748|nr:SDR family oxidoreductase [Exiguobacterium sp. BMC-KP]KOP30632.1 NmrA family protein [Exiguobacterium sp. BMC-KP]
MKWLITGATGKLGAQIVQQLSERVGVENVAVSVRNVEKAASLAAQGIDVRRGDFDQPETLTHAFQDIDRLLIISTDGEEAIRIRQHQTAVTAAKEAGVKLIGYTSIANAAHSTNGLARTHRVTEEAIQATGIPYVFFRNNWYLENELATIEAVAQGANWLTAAGEGKVGWALQEEYAIAIATGLTLEQPQAIYELSGPLHTQAELAAAVGAVLNQSVILDQVDATTYGERMKAAGLPDFLLPMLIGIQADIAAGTLAVESDDFEALLGRPVTTLEESVRILLKR